MQDLISRQDAIDAINHICPVDTEYDCALLDRVDVRCVLSDLPSAEPEIIRCKDCKYWRRQTNYVGAPLSFGFCESDYMWRSLYGETYEVSHIDTDDTFYCGYAERKEE